MVDASYKPYGLEPIETASRDEIAALQTERLAWSLKHAYDNVEAYRKKFDAAGVKPQDFKRLEDIAKFPFTTKADLRENYPFGMFAVPQDRIVRIHASSGTTGKPTVVGYTQADIDNWANLMARSIRASGGRPGMKVHIAYGYGLFTGGLGAHYGAERLGCAVIPVSGGMTERQVQLICDFKPDIIMVTPSYMLAILDEFRAKGLDPRESSLSIGIFGAEPWTNQMRGEIEEAFAMDAVDIFGLSEVMGPGVANECVETKDGLHIWEDHFYPEVIDPESGNPLPDGEKGELVFTTLTKEGLPVIRYRTRDLTRLLPGTARTHRRMEKVTGRSDDMMIIRGVNVFPTQIEELLLRCQGLSPHYLIELSRQERLDVATIFVEARPDCGEATTRNAEAAALAMHIRNTIGIGISVMVRDPGTIERSAGKARRVVDKRPK
ncbi:phenylacetate--CoA ligase PaaK [Pseudorhodoplanes sinuspersici]|uniref:Phenylacetate-coenzyme A ligase n=1 Tax=Pseudorhodoplanes sinuspersici TaxID=1235591 RepID=A0A1W6ZTK3_9HYPH|nr:phenylacetate--CoA ligase PaaK [Pseudorhodoplanes sinuspersici]ARQ00653.1 phenylacetate--CoA ligase [Pseudorhodoplanes sinuspersici]RKE72257.1 phenylacetate-CoA ligase [Pseudorhodoplanes sinuspersici]